ncbi:hypothetical protein HDV04_001806 [Boothiomyces sp. JEL0838]|nr:hypothetical protein HDV04_001806 [Boothiomyces sp. JEL0838]
MFQETRFYAGLILFAAAALTSFVRTTVTNNYSFVDRIWSIIPIAYGWILASSIRGYVMCCLITVWGCRLTFNFWRRGGYKPGEQDYRWPVLQTIITNPIQWHLFNFFFISSYQLFLLFLITLPVYVASADPSDFNYKDVIFVVLFLLLLAGEATADNQQLAFQTKKYELLKDKPIEEIEMPYRLGFCTTGLFRYSRHPNFFCEFSMWWTISFFGIKSCVVNGDWSWWVANFTGPVLLTLLFLGSTQFTESITTKKYPRYAEYQKSTSMLVPWTPGKIEL